MTLRAEDIPLIKSLEDVAIGELDRQFLNGEIEASSTEDAFFDAVDGELNGRPDWYKVITKVMEAFWDEEGR